MCVAEPGRAQSGTAGAAAESRHVLPARTRQKNDEATEIFMVGQARQVRGVERFEGDSTCLRLGRDSPQSIAAIIRDEQGSVFRHRDAHGPAPDALRVDHEAGEKVLVFAGWNSVLSNYPHDFIAGSRMAVP